MQDRAKNRHHQYDVRRLLSEAGRKDLIEILASVESEMNRVAMRELRPIRLRIDSHLYEGFQSRSTLSVLHSLTGLCPRGDGALVRTTLIDADKGQYWICISCERNGSHRFLSYEAVRLP